MIICRYVDTLAINISPTLYSVSVKSVYCLRERNERHFPRCCVISLYLFQTMLFCRKIFDPLLSPLKLTSEMTFSFIKKSLESAVPRHQVEALTWLQVKQTKRRLFLHVDI